MLAVLSVYLNYETIPIDMDRAIAQYAVVRSLHPVGALAYYNYLEGYSVENGNVRRIVLMPTPEHARRMSQLDNHPSDKR
jgi:hypothetical protein